MCREEIGTLREALQIAALDVAAMKEKTGVSDQVMEGVVDVDVVEIDSNGGDSNGDVLAPAIHPLPEEVIVEDSSADGYELD